MGKERHEGKRHARWKRDAEQHMSLLSQTAIMSAPHSFSIIGESVCLEPQYCHGIKIPCQILLLPFVYALCETSLRPFMEVAVSKPNLRHNDSSQNKATGKGLLQAGRAALANNYSEAKKCVHLYAMRNRPDFCYVYTAASSWVFSRVVDMYKQV